MTDWNTYFADKAVAFYFIGLTLAVLLLYLLYRQAKDFFLAARFFWAAGAVVASFVVAHFLNRTSFFQGSSLDPSFIPWAGMAFLATLLMVDIFLLFGKRDVLRVERRLPKVFSLGDPNPIRICIENLSDNKYEASFIDELPPEFQKRDFQKFFQLSEREELNISYDLQPTVRGAYSFGNVHVYLKSFLGLAIRRHEEHCPMTLPVYPSLIQMKAFELKAFKRSSLNQGGVKRMRRIGHSYEFEQIKDYVRGDDFRSINWKATSRANKLMVNQYEDERSQQVYCILDKGRSMTMPFGGLTLMDHAVNATLVISNIALKKHDRAGMMTFSDTIGATIKADRRASQLNTILQTLYREKLRNMEANYELLYRATRNLITGRSLVFLFTNFESMYALERVLPLLRRINNQHLLVVVFFENTEIRAFSEEPAESIAEIYYQTVARKAIYDKEQIVYKLEQYGIQAILTKPEELSMNTVNKYLELKSRGLI